jgi:hypothetical protein
MTRIAIAAVALLAGMPVVVSAHVLDEYLQATRIELDRHAVGLEIDLTPGVEIAPLVFVEINTNRDGVISDAEGRTYAARVLREVVLTADGQPLKARLVNATYPTYEEMRTGTGTIRLRFRAAVRNDRPGQHRIFFRNGHQPERSVFVVNTLIPRAEGLVIDRQDRDRLQRELRLDFTVTPALISAVRFEWQTMLAAMMLAVACCVLVPCSVRL